VSPGRHCGARTSCSATASSTSHSASPSLNKTSASRGHDTFGACEISPLTSPGRTSSPRVSQHLSSSQHRRPRKHNSVLDVHGTFARICLNWATIVTRRGGEAYIKRVSTLVSRECEANGLRISGEKWTLVSPPPHQQLSSVRSVARRRRGSFTGTLLASQIVELLARLPGAVMEMVMPPNVTSA
jgi:hypothetical protein